MKKYSSILLVSTMVISLITGCSKPQQSSTASISSQISASSTTSNSDTTSTQEVKVLRYHSANPENDPRTQAGYYLRDRVAEKTNKLVIEVYPDAQLGASEDVHAMIAMGENIASATDSAWFSSLQPGFDILGGPFFTETEEELYKIAQTDWFKEQVAELESKGVKILAPNWMDGSRHLMTKFPVKTPTDLKGKKIRVPNIQVSTDMMDALGATPTPMPLTEMYSALQQGVIDGCENPYATLAARKTQEVCKYLTITAHQKMLSLFFISTDFYNSLEPDVQEALTQSALETGEYFSKVLMPKANEQALETFKEAGVTIIDDADIKAFRDATLSVYNNWSMDTYNLIQEQLAAVK